MCIPAYKSDGSIGCSIVMDPENESVFISCGSKTQLSVRGKALQAIYTTRSIIWDAPFVKAKGILTAILSKLKKRMKAYDE